MKPITEYCNQLSSIDEYLSTKEIDRRMLNIPKYGASVDEIIEWIKAQQIEIIDAKDFVDYNGTMRTPEFGKLLIEKGPCDETTDNTWWVSVHNHPSTRRVQRVVLRTKIKESFYYSAKDEDRNKKHPTTFDGAISKIIKMLNDPETIL